MTVMTMAEERVRRYMINELNAVNLAWEIEDPPIENITRIQCWGIPADVEGVRSVRLVIVEIFEDGGWQLFAEVGPNDIAGTTKCVKALDILERKATSDGEED